MYILIMVLNLIQVQNFHFLTVAWEKNAIIFGADIISSSVHIDNKKRNILVFGEGPTQGLDDTILIAEAKYSFKFT